MTIFTQKVRTIYFIRPIGRYTPVKIGCSENPEKRRQSLASQVGAPLEIAAQMAGSLDDERRIHSFIWHQHKGGEWFDWCPELQKIIDAVEIGDFDIESLPQAEVRAMPGKRKPWTEEQKLRVRRRHRSMRGAAGEKHGVGGANADRQAGIREHTGPSSHSGRAAS